MMRCSEVRELLEAYIEGELDESEQEVVSVHIADCESCKQELALTRSIPRLVNSLPTPPVPEDVIPNTLERLSEAKSSRWTRSSGAFLLRRWQFVTAACLLLVLLGIGYQRMNKERGITGEEAPPQALVGAPGASALRAVERVKPSVGIAKAKAHDVQIAVSAKGKSRITNEEVTSAVEEIKLAFGIVREATEDIQLVVLTEGASVLDVTKSKSRDTMRVLSEAQIEVADKLRRSLAFLTQQPEEVEKP